mgnify:CR=1 FL=1|tara:strand:+ start:40 stop:387 length:348 start_codon:yes stop_codon:yes gene_type:complete
MHIPIYANHQHQITIDTYISACKQFAQDVSTKNKYNNFLDVLDIIIEYHNNYRKNGNYYDWLMIIPINLSVATNGFFAGIETKRNATVVRAYKVVLEQLVHDTVDKINLIEPKNE